MEPVARVAVVTGAGRGIGLEVVRQLAGRGMDVVLTSPNRIEGKAASAKLLRQGLNVTFHLLDVVNEKHIRVSRTFVLKKFGRIDILVNNAGVMFDSGRSKVEGEEMLDPSVCVHNVQGCIRNERGNVYNEKTAAAVG